MSLPLLALPVQGERFRLDPGDPGKLAVIRSKDQVTVGAFEIEFREGTLTIRSLCIDPPHRSYGAGTEAARLLITAAEAAGVSLVRAWAHPNLGLSAYFWGRMGLRPRHGEGPEGGIWYERRTIPGPGTPLSPG